MVSKPITSCSVTRWGSTPHGMKCSQRTKTVGAVRPLERGVQVECLVDVLDELVSSDEPQEKLTRFATALHEVFAFSRSKKHMIQRQLGRLEPNPSLKYRAREVMRNIPVMST